MLRKKKSDKENRIRNQKLSTRNSNRVSKRRERIIKKRKRNRVITILILILLISTFLLISYFSRKKSNKSKNISAIGRYYNNSDFSNKYNQFNNNLYYKKYLYEEGNYNLLQNTDWEIKNKYIGNFEYYLWDKIQTYLDEKNLSQDDFSLSIKQNDEYLLLLNSNVEYNVDVVDIIYLLMIRDGIDNKSINLDDSISLIKSDLENGSNIYSESSINYKYNIEKILRDTLNIKDSASRSMLNRYLAGKNISVENYLAEKLGKSNIENYTTKDMVKLIEIYNSSNSIINSLFSNIFNNSDDLFTNSIYSNVGNVNKSVISDSQIYECGVVNSDSKFYYAIYSSVLSKEQIQEIGDIVNRTISEINLIRSIQN